MLTAPVADVALYAANVDLFAVYEKDLVVFGCDGWDLGGEGGGGLGGGGGGGGGFGGGYDGGGFGDGFGGGDCCFCGCCGCAGAGETVAGDVALGAGAGLAEDFGYVGGFGVFPEAPAFEAGFVHFGAGGSG